MDREDFRRSLADDEPSPELPRELQALWHAGRGRWDRAHAIVQTRDDAESCRIHAYLHRVEGDPSNAAYWYARAGRRMPESDLQTEWDMLVSELLAR
jgi:hypothetical protein